MNGGLLKSASAVAILAAAGLFGASPAKAADLGGDCCADLEERVAELEATTVRKGNRKVSLQISGYVSQHVLFWNDGTQKDMYIGDGGNYGSRWRFTGTAKISPTLTAGFLYEQQFHSTGINAQNQLNNGADLGATGPGVAAAGSSAGSCAIENPRSNSQGCPQLRQNVVYLKDSRLGAVKLGHGSTSTDDLILIDVGGLVGAATPDSALYGGGMLLRGKNGQFATNGAGTAGITWASAIRGIDTFDTARRNFVMYETPTLHGFTGQAAWAEDNFWDIALRYAGEFNGVRLAGGIGYLEDTNFNGSSQLFNRDGALAFQNYNVKSKELKGSASVLHVPTGLFLTGAMGRRELSGDVTGGTAIGTNPYAGPDNRFWWLSGGIAKNHFGIGNTVLYGEYGEHKGGLAQVAAISVGTTAANASGLSLTEDNKVTQWGLGIVQNIDAAAMEVFLAYKNYKLDYAGSLGTTAAGVNNNFNDLSMVIVGTRIQF